VLLNLCSDDGLFFYKTLRAIAMTAAVYAVVLTYGFLAEPPWYIL
jgi:hypothetical protein